MSAPHDVFFTSMCSCCAKRVLATRALREDSAELFWACIHCAKELDEADGQWISPEQLEDVGCFLVDEPREDHKHGEHGGCRDGSCGVRQPKMA